MTFNEKVATPYERHKALNHKISRYSPDGIDIIEECDTCGERYLFTPAFNYPLHLTPNYDIRIKNGGSK